MGPGVQRVSVHSLEDLALISFWNRERTPRFGSITVQSMKGDGKKIVVSFCERGRAKQRLTSNDDWAASIVVIGRNVVLGSCDDIHLVCTFTGT